MSDAIDVTTSQRKTILELLKRYLPGTVVWAYGSRVKWTARLGSDLDMVVFSSRDQKRQVSDLQEAFEESNLPFQVDLFVWDEVPEEFHANIEAEHVVLQEQGEGARERGDEWQEIAVQEFADVKSGKRLPKGEKLVEEPTNHPYIRLVDVDDGKVRKANLKFLTREIQNKISRYIVRENDVCLAIVGHTIGMTFLIESEFDGANLGW